jgi:hypothetical protein
MIAASGMLAGGGIGPNNNQSTAISNSLSNPLLTAYLNVANNANVGNVSGLTTTLSSLPSAFSSANTVSHQVPAQAAKMAPSTSSFISLHSGATAFGSSGMDFGAALSTFGGKSFGSLGVGVSNFAGANTGGITSAMPGFSQLANQQKTSAFGSAGSSLNPQLLAQGQAAMASASLSDGLKGVGAGIKNYGTLQDFSNPQGMGAQGMLVALQQQGLADSTGINDGITSAGYDPKVPTLVPDNTLHSVFSSITGSNLTKIIKQTGANPVQTPRSLNDLLDPTYMLSPGAMNAMGLKPGSGVTGLKSLGNTLTNIGAPMSGTSASALLGGMQTKVGPYLSSLTSLVPASVSASLSPMLGAGSSPFGTPTMTDMMGSLSGVHTPSFQNINTQFNSISGSPTGQALTTALTTMNTALTANVGTASAYSSLQTAVTNFNTQANANSGLSGALNSAMASVGTITAQLSKELSNFSLAGINLSSPPSVPGGSGPTLSFASKLHSLGVDKLQLGHNDVLNGAATNDLTGDAIKGALLEGKNVAAMAGAGKSSPTVSSTTAALATANANNIGPLIQAYNSAKSAEQAAQAALNNSTTATVANLTTAYNNAHDASTTAENNMMTAANSAGGSALAQAQAAQAQWVK